MSNKAKKLNDPSVHAVFHRTGRTWRAVVVRNGRDGHSPPEVLASREFPPSTEARIESWLDEHSVASITCVLPASAVICRTCSLPDAPMEQLEPALRLQAEAHLFGIAPAHRMAMAVLEQSPGETARSGIILAWPESSEVAVPATSRPVTFTPDIAALAALIDGHRPPQPLLWLDRTSGSVALALSHAGGVSFRCLREEDEDAQAWSASVGRAIAETGLNAGHTAEFIESVVQATQEELAGSAADESRLVVPVDVIERSVERLSGVNTDAAWWSQYGIAAGAVLVRSGPLAPLSQLMDAAPQQRPSRMRDLVEGLSSPKTAWGLAVACAIVLMFGPLVMNWTRLKLLEMRHADIEAKLRLVSEARDSLVVYRELGNSASPMSKVLADIACNTPEGVDLDSIRINPGGSFNAYGRALPHGGRTATEVVVQMQQNLRQSRIFDEITLNWGDSDAYGNYEFEIAAKLKNPYRQFNYPEELDFAKLTLAQRLYGVDPEQGDDDQDQTAGAPSTRNEPIDLPGDGPAQPDDSQEHLAATDDPYAELYETSTSRVDRPTARPSSSFGGGATTIDATRGHASLAPSQDIPEPLSQAQIRAMSDAEVNDMLVRIGQARRAVKHGDDEELKERLQREFNWLMARMRGEM